MSRYTQLSTFVSVLVLSLCLGSGFQAGALAQAVKTTICHLPTQGNEDPKTLELPADVAQRHLSNHPNDYTGRCGETKFVIVAVSGTLEEGWVPVRLVPIGKREDKRKLRAMLPIA